ncbi:O-antigen ligase family protein [Shewanella frigidimarina]|nr:O-antigen ligase family protein [Shewanella frigidimarina]
MTVLLIFGFLYYFKVLNFIYGFIFSSDQSLLDASLEGNPVNKFSGSIVILLVIFCLYYNKVIQTATFWRQTYLMWILPLFCFLSIIWSVEPLYTFKRSIAILAVFLFALHLVTFYKSIDLLRFIGYVIGMCATVGLLIALISPSAVFIEGGIRGGAFVGILSDKNAGARAYAIGLTILFPYFINKDIKSTLLIIPTFIALCLSQSASGIALAGIGIATVLFFSIYPYERNSQNILRQIIFSFLLFIIIGLFIYLAKEIAFYILERDSDLTDRKLIWEIIQPYVDSKSMLGYGFGAFWTSISAQDFIDRWGFIGNAHNGYIETKLDGGIVFLILTTSLIFYSAIKSFIRIPFESIARESSVSFAIIVIVLVANTIGYVIPNYRALDFFILLVVMFSSISFKGN